MRDRLFASISIDSRHSPFAPRHANVFWMHAQCWGLENQPNERLEIESLLEPDSVTEFRPSHVSSASAARLRTASTFPSFTFA
jgi:hypothetical protein